MRHRPDAERSGQGRCSAIGSRRDPDVSAIPALRTACFTSSSSTAVGYGSRPVTAKWQQGVSATPPGVGSGEQAHVQPARRASASA